MRTLAVLCALWTMGCGAAPRKPVARDETASQVRKLAAGLMAREGVPGLTLVLLDNGQVVLDEAMGLADTQTREPVRRDTVFQAASLGKPLFAYAVMELAQRGKLDLDAPLSGYLTQPYLHELRPWLTGSRAKTAVRDPRLGRVTARMVLSHTTGLPNWAGENGLRFERDPGAAWLYSGEGFVYLQRVVEQVTGQHLREFMREAVFEPLRMHDSDFVWTPRYSGRLASGHDRGGTPVPAIPATRPLAAASLYTTATDYARFVAVFTAGDLPDAAARMLEPAVPVDATLSMSWGLGWALERSGARTAFFHWGANPGYQAFATGSRDSRRAMVLLSNSDRGLNVAAGLARASGGAHRVFAFPMLSPAD